MEKTFSVFDIKRDAKIEKIYKDFNKLSDDEKNVARDIYKNMIDADPILIRKTIEKTLNKPATSEQTEMFDSIASLLDSLQDTEKGARVIPFDEYTNILAKRYNQDNVHPKSDMFGNIKKSTIIEQKGKLTLIDYYKDIADRYQALSECQMKFIESICAFLNEDEED